MDATKEFKRWHVNTEEANQLAGWLRRNGIESNADLVESLIEDRDAYLDEVQRTNENEARIMADLLDTREERDRLRAELQAVRNELTKHGPSCDRCQSSHCCSVAGCTPPLCVTDPEGSLPLWMPWTNEEVRKSIDAVYAQVDALQAELAARPVAVEVPEPTVQQWLHEVLDPAEADPDPHATMRHATRWFREHIRSIPSDRVLNDGEVAIRADVLSAMEGCIATLRADAELIPSKALDYLDALRSNGGEA